MDYQIASGYLSGTFEFVGALPYLHSIINKKTKPNRATWLIWSLVSVILFCTYYLSGARATLWQPGAAVLFNVVFAFLAFRHSGMSRVGKLDAGCFLGAMLALIAWGLTRNPLIGMTVIVIVAIIGSVPTILKVYENPGSEDRLTWLLWSLAALANLFAVKSWTFAIALYPIEVAVVIPLIFALNLRKKPPKRVACFGNQ